MEREDRLNSMLDNLKKNSNKELQKNVEDLRAALDSCEQQEKALEENVEQLRSNFTDAVNMSCTKLVDEKKSMRSKQKADICLAIKDLENQIENNNNFLSHCGQRIREGGLNLMKFHPNPPKPKYHSVPQLPLNKIEEVSSKEIIDMITSCMGGAQGGAKVPVTQENILLVFLDCYQRQESNMQILHWWEVFSVMKVFVLCVQ